ncbi:MAG: hypothetical protein ACLPHI_15260 [Terriglobales bacterium]
MNPSNEPFRTLGRVIDELERIREELFVLQRSMERMEPVGSESGDDGGSNGGRNDPGNGSRGNGKGKKRQTEDGLTRLRRARRKR